MNFKAKLFLLYLAIFTILFFPTFGKIKTKMENQMNYQTSLIELSDKNDVRDKFLGALLDLMETKLQNWK